MSRSGGVAMARRRDWPDIMYTAVAEVGEYRVSFKVYAIEGLGNGVTPLWHRDGSPCHPDPVDSIEEAEPYLHGDVKWDGCSNWHFDEQDRVMLHGCGRGDLVALGSVMARCWDWAADILPTWDGGAS